MIEFFHLSTLHLSLTLSALMAQVDMMMIADDRWIEGQLSSQLWVVSDCVVSTHLSPKREY